MNPSTLFEIYKIEEALAARNALLKVVVGSWAAKNHPEDHLRELFDREKCSLWILHRSSRETQQWFHKNDIPSLIRGLAHENIPLPQLDVDWEATARHASASLWRSGHRNVAIIAPVEKLRGIVAACNGALGFQGEDWKAHIITDSGERSGLVQKLNTFFNDHPEVTALITTRSRQVITLWGWAGARGLRIPRDISVISLASEYFMQDFYPKVSYYDVNNEQISRRVIRSVMRIMEGHSISRNSEWLIPDYFPGGSIQTINSPS